MNLEYHPEEFEAPSASLVYPGGEIPNTPPGSSASVKAGPGVISGRAITIVTTTECPPQKHTWVYGNLVCNPADKPAIVAQLEREGHSAAEPTRQQLRAVTRWAEKRLARLAVAGMRKLP